MKTRTREVTKVERIYGNESREHLRLTEELDRAELCKATAVLLFLPGISWLAYALMAWLDLEVNGFVTAPWWKELYRETVN